MDYLSFKFFEDSFKKLFTSIKTLTRTMSALVTRLAEVLEFLASKEFALKEELALTKAALAEALANDVASSEAITSALVEAEQARAIAAEAQAKVVELQGLVDADAEEDAAISALLEAVIAPVVEPAPVEPTPEPAPVEPEPEVEPAPVEIVEEALDPEEELIEDEA